MSHKVEVFWLEECNKCGHGWAIVETTEGTEDFLFDGDKILCPSCGHTGQVAVTDDYAEDCVAYAVWNDANLPPDVTQSLKEVS